MTIRAPFAVALVAVALPATAANVPLCSGLTVVTAINSAKGDYESIKTIESVSNDRIRIKYSAEAPNFDPLDPSPLSGRPVSKVLVYRTVRAVDWRSATMYEQIFTATSDESIPETTAIGLSSAVLKALKTKGQADIALSNANGEVALKGNREERPNAYDYMAPMTIKRLGIVKLPVLVNDSRVDLPTIHAGGEAADGERSEFFILDDDNNPLMIKMRLGIGVIKPITGEDALEICEMTRKALAAAPANPDTQLGWELSRCDQKSDRDRDVLRVIKITYRCGGGMQLAGGGGSGGGGAGAGGGAGGGSAGAGQLEQQLEKNRRADVYSIYFSFNSDAIRDESEPTLKEIAAVMRKHPDWKLTVNGHTDNVAGDAYNLALSQRRSAAVKNALVTRYKIDPARLGTAGYGKSQPKETNDTIEGRARNRRVELVRM